MRNLLTLLLLSPAIVLGQGASAPIAGILSKYPATLHQQLGPSCELMSAVTMIEYKTYEALAFEGPGDEVYSPELGKADFVELSVAVPKKVVKLTKKSGFDVRVQSIAAPDPSARPTTNGSSCPTPDQAVAIANQQRDGRRVELQSHLYKLNAPNNRVTPPIPIREAHHESGANTGNAGLDGKPKVKHGTVTVVIAIDPDGKVDDAKVARSLDPVLDRRALDAVRRSEFLPARMDGLPVAVQMPIEVEFHID